MPDSDQNQFSLLEIEQLVTDTLEPSRRRQLEAAAQADPELDAQIQRIRAEVDDARHDLPRIMLEEDPVPWWRRAMPLLVLASAAVVAVFVLQPSTDPRPGPEGPSEVFRGALDVSIHRVRMGDAVEQGVLIEGRAGDHMQYEVTAPNEGFITVWDIQDNGEVQAWLEPRPAHPGQSVQGAVVLDDYDGLERVFFVHSKEPIALEDVERAVRRLGTEPIANMDHLPGLGGAQRSVMITKESP